MRIRPVVIGGLAAVLALTAMSCSSNSESSSSTTAAPTTSEVIGNVLPPVVLSESETSTTVSVGTTVVFDLGDPGEGRFVAESSDAAVFKVEGEGKTEGSYTTNAGGKAVAAGTAEVTVQFFGSTNGVGAPTTFTITVK